MEFKVSVWYTGTPEEFLNHVIGAIHSCERMGLFSDYAEALKGHLASNRVMTQQHPLSRLPGQSQNGQEYKKLNLKS